MLTKKNNYYFINSLGRYWEMVERLKVNHFYTSPAAIRKMMKADENYVGEYDVSSLRTIASGYFGSIKQQ